MGERSLNMYTRWRAVMMLDLGVAVADVAEHLDTTVEEVEAAVKAERARLPKYDLTITEEGYGGTQTD